MKAWVFLIVGLVLLLVGVTWVLQGLDVLAGSFMSGQKLWFAIGLLLGLAGLTALMTGVRRLSVSRR